MGYHMELVNDIITKRVLIYEVGNIDNQYYLDAIKSIDETKYSTSRYFSKENGKIYMTITIKLIEN